MPLCSVKSQWALSNARAKLDIRGLIKSGNRTAAGRDRERGVFWRQPLFSEADRQS